MKKVTFTVSTGIIGSKRSKTVEFDDNITDDQIDEYFKEWLWDTIDATWYVEEEKTK